MADRATRIRTRSVAQLAFTPALLDSLYGLANRIMAEDAAHFRLPADSNDAAPGGIGRATRLPMRELAQRCASDCAIRW